MKTRQGERIPSALFLRHTKPLDRQRRSPDRKNRWGKGWRKYGEI
ncbi:hypothetical protein B4113_2735 [Geobacillus sp. B4113_201601]|nr:hypothetical protein B4113_2735 [Geobacillus sp. B4113_201601]